MEVEFGISPVKKDSHSIFTDITSAGTAASAIARLFFLGALEEEAGEAFRPHDQVVRSTFVTVLARLFALPEQLEIRKDPFDDVSRDDYFAPEIIAAEKAGIDLGIEGKSFRPHEPITRVEACRIITSFLGIIRKSSSTSFEDVKSKDSDVIYTCHSRHLLRAHDEENALFGGDSSLTRGEMAVLLYRAAIKE